MPAFLGIDTSNYTTSAAVYDPENDKRYQNRRLLPVKQGELGLRQADAVFSHVKQLGSITEELFENCPVEVSAVGVSDRPRDVEGSYMPCFLVGETAARVASSVMGVPLYRFSHQAGHVAAALYSASSLELIGHSFLAFHLSGGTTEGLLVEPDSEKVIKCSRVCSSLDLKAGQAVDRVGAMLGLDFPAGAQLEALALESGAEYKLRPVMKGGDCCLSGVENRCRSMIEAGLPPQDVALRCLMEIECALAGMTEALLKEYGELPIVYAGGVMSNSIIRQGIESRFGGIFAKAGFSTDNAAGTAVLTAIKHEEK